MLLSAVSVLVVAQSSSEFPEGLVNNPVCVFCFSLQLLVGTCLSVRRIQRVSIINVHRSSCKVPVIFSHFNPSWIFLEKSSAKLHEHLCNGIRVPSCRRTDMTKLIFAFHNAANSPKKVCT